MEDSAEKNMHEGHRQRMYNRLEEFGGESFETHELLEMMLYSSCKRCDTNPIAHRLLDRFGSLTGVFTASADELAKVEGVGLSTANMLKTSYACLKRMLQESVDSGESLRKSVDVKNYCAGLFRYEKTEQLRMIFLNDDYKLISQEIISVGSIEAVKPDMLEVVAKVVSRRAPIVMLTHNHPKGSEMPSNEDKMLTRNLYNLLERADIYLADHIVVGMHGCISMRENDLLPDIW